MNKVHKLFIKIFFFLLSFNLNQATQLPEDPKKKNLVSFYRNKLNNLANGCNGTIEIKGGLTRLNTIFNDAIEKSLLSELGKDIIAQALGFGHTQIVDYFVKNNIKLDNPDGNWNMHLFWACRPDEIYYFNDKSRHMCEFYHHWLATPLHWAAGEGNIATVKYFINQDRTLLLNYKCF